MIIAALLLPLAIGLAALAVEGGLWYADRHDLRAMADAAAIAAGWARLDEEDEEAAAADAASELGYDDTDMDSIEVISPPSSGAYEGDDDAIEVVITRTRPLMLSTLFLDTDTVEISMRAVVQMGSDLNEACVLALDPNASGAVDIGGNGAVDLNGCGFMANSNSDSAITVRGSADVDADYLATAGDISTSGNPDTTGVAQNITGTPQISDPFGDITPSPPACTYNNVVTVNPNQTTTLSGGNYCDGLNLKGNATLNSGTYYITGGALSISSQAVVTGAEVTFVITGTATLNINGQASITLTAPDDAGATYNGLVFFSTSTASQTVMINGGADLSLNGAMYFRNQDIQFSGNSGSAGGCLRIVAQTVAITGATGMGASCDQYDLPSFAPNNQLTLVE